MIETYMPMIFISKKNGLAYKDARLRKPHTCGEIHEGNEVRLDHGDIFKCSQGHSTIIYGDITTK